MECCVGQFLKRAKDFKLLNIVPAKRSSWTLGPGWLFPFGEVDFNLFKDIREENDNFSSETALTYVQCVWRSALQIYTDGSKDPLCVKTCCGFSVHQLDLSLVINKLMICVYSRNRSHPKCTSVGRRVKP